jgi:tetratricopeptide (TPR) repeat protein
MRSRRRLRELALAALVSCVACLAYPRVSAAEDTTEDGNVTAARQHFEKARKYYGQGAYREAITELEAAHALDPSAKDLVFNLGVVHEKLADIDEALTWFRLFTTMDLTPQERERADAYVKRLEGAKKELEQPQAVAAKPGAPPRGRVQPPEAALAPPRPARTLYGRMDGWTVGALSVTSAGLVLGVVMGIKALQDQPTSPFETGRDGTYDDLVVRHNDAFREAVIADVGFGVSAAGAIASAYLYFARPRMTAMQRSGSTTVSATPLTGGAALFVQGCF